ncbi:MAG: SMP-30/gluconolactonase/LRE family protein [Pseudomonadales bacterium]|nr:SMP-30/gluconolactonase/LRE family protein [Pseudomonadales bacterium]
MLPALIRRLAMDILTDGLSFPEGPRWHDGRLYFSDFYRHVVETVTEDGRRTTIADVPNQPSGLGWLPDGCLLIVSMLDRKLLRQEPDGTLTEHADLNGVATWHCNDMIVDSQGRAYVGNFGFDTHGDVPPSPARLARVDPDGSVTAVADELQFPNGTIIFPDGATIVIAETRAMRLTAFDIDASGNLSNRRVWADIDPHVPDGICLDAEGGIWVADPRGNCVIRVLKGGEITDRIDTGRGAFACMLGGNDGRTLFVCTATGSGPHAEARRDGRIESTKVEIPRDGLP